MVHIHYTPADLSAATPTFRPRANQQFTDISIVRGELLVVRSVRSVGYLGQEQQWNLIHPPYVGLARGPSLLNRWGFELSTESPRDYPGAWSVRLLFPLWAMAIFAAGMLGWWFARFRRFSRTSGVCEKCGYDLCATRARCPECGTVPSKTINT
jgi:hypothetical protein